MEHEDDKLLYCFSDSKNVDLLIGAAWENSSPGAIVGPTLACLLKKQFLLLKTSDKNWYENDFPPSGFSPDQLKEIKKTTIAGLLCSIRGGTEKIQPKALEQEDPYL